MLLAIESALVAPPQAQNPWNTCPPYKGDIFYNTLMDHTTASSIKPSMQFAIQTGRTSPETPCLSLARPNAHFIITTRMTHEKSSLCFKKEKIDVRLILTLWTPKFK